MFNALIKQVVPTAQDNIIDIGVASDQTYLSSNYFEAIYPNKHKITAAGIDDASFLETLYLGMRFVRANALNMPFQNGTFDLVHSSAVLEHVGSLQNQARMISECLS
jgi:ubiquinone/menaquinone biosynthesis C-methylase UbiE